VFVSKSRLDELQAQLSALTNELASVRDNNRQLQAQLSAVGQELASTRADNEQLHAQLFAVGRELASARADKARLAAELANYRSSPGGTVTRLTPEQRRYLDREALVLLPRLLDLLPAGERVVIVDAGAREVDADPRWRPFPPARLRFFGFEADAAEAQRLNQIAGPEGLERKFYPAGLWGSSGTVPFDLNKAAGGSSFLAQNRTLTDRWKFENATDTALARETFYPTRTADMTVVSLADWAGREGVREVDFLKINVQGGELEILNGAGPGARQSG